MASKLSKKWEIISPDCMGDFDKKDSGPCFGFYKSEYSR